MHPDLRWQINTHRIAHRIIDDEAMIIDFESGFYYALDDTGTRIWAGITQSFTFQELIAALEQVYDCELAAMIAATSDFLNQLQTEGLIVPATAALVAAETGSAYPLTLPDPANRQNFAAPQLAKYTDMHDLLLLDPIHEVDESGWPTQRQPST